MIFGRRRPEQPPEPDWDDPMWVPQPLERWIEPEEVAERLRRRRGRWRALRHAAVLLLVILLVGGLGVIAGGAVLGRWELPWSPSPRRVVAEASPSTGVTAAPDCERAVVVPAAAQGTSVQVLNATSRPGLAGSVADELELRGFTVTEVGNFRTPVPEPAVVRFPAGAEPAALAAAAHLAGAVVQPDPEAAVVTVLLGDGWTAINTVEVAAPLAVAPQPSVVDCAVPAPAPSDAVAPVVP